ncbi:hypothetical protein BJ322DRAFT_100743 [Thelephora terrestris]|uniref:DUF1996 domain-containing protein n=1 Tax=Thelephora terrestris TaxID=56493 RepID=A0A9P6LDH2_9AGAM|nr:hypothetical protein BJ322DRAFT_100743 [Thelephora terrestris]
MITFSSFVLLALTASAKAYFLVGQSILVIERADPIVSPGAVAGHVHRVIGGSNFGVEIPSSDYLRESECTSSGIQEDKSAYWFPQLYFEYADGSFELVPGGPVTYYLFPDQSGQTTIFPDNFRMISGNSAQAPPLGSFAQEAVSFLCLDFNGVSTKSNFLPETPCPSGVRAQLNFQSCWNGKDVDSSDHKSHVSYRSGGPDSGDCPSDFPVNLPRIFNEMYYDTGSFNNKTSQAKNPNQPFVFSNGDATGAMYHGDFYMGWERATLQRVVDECHCNPFGDFTCCVQQGIMTRPTTTCSITTQINEEVTGRLPKLPGNNPVRLNGELPQPDPNPPSLRCDVQVISQPVTKREENLFGARGHNRFSKRDDCTKS